MSVYRRISVHRIKDNIELSSDMFAQSGTLIACAGTIITREFLTRIQRMGIDTVSVPAELVPELTGFHCEVFPDNLDEYADNFLLRNELEAGKQALLNCDVEAAHDTARQIADKLMSAGDLRKEVEALKYGNESVITHSLNVAVMAGAIGVAMGLPPKDIDVLITGGMLHDIGKLYTAPFILNKPGRLTDEEFEVMKKHTRKGYERLKEHENLDERIPLIALQHHENEDGTGYPNGLVRDEIIPEARVIHVVDVYEAMTAKRCYKDPILPGDVIEYCMSNCASMFDTRSLSVFLHTVPAYRKGDRVRLSNQHPAIVRQSNALNSLRPEVEDLSTHEVFNMYTNRDKLNLTIVSLDEQVS